MEAACEGWKARLRLGFCASEGRTLLARREHAGPLLVQKPFYPEGTTCHVYLIHPPGGVVGGDTIDLGVQCDPGSQVLLTTPAAGKFYRSRGPWAKQKNRFEVMDGALLEWLPQETILFDDCRVESLTRFELEDGARMIGWEMVALGRPACNEGFARGRARMGLEVWKDGVPLLLEQLNLDAAMFASPCGLNKKPLSATLVAYPATPRELDAARDLAGERRDFGATLIDRLLICRALGLQAEPVRNLLVSIWRAIRPGMAGKPACEPRIWAT
ncbi:MAG: urease accessory protein UreD [Methylococcus sp.]|nr:MAG: urease accessory protein UreD [Methylococcus sp.]